MGLMALPAMALMGGGFGDIFSPPKPPKMESYAPPPSFTAPPATTPNTTPMPQPALRSPLLASPQEDVLESPAYGLEDEFLRRSRQPGGGFGV